jgi:hypothetical protein
MHTIVLQQTGKILHSRSSVSHRVHRVAMTTFWRTFHHGGKISPAWCGRGVARPPPFTISTITYKVVVYAPTERADILPLFLLYPYMYSVVSAAMVGNQDHPQYPSLACMLL